MNEISQETISELIKRIEGESPKAHEAFCRYAMLPESQRTIKQAIALLPESTGLAGATIKEYAKLYRWNERVGSIISYLLMLNIREQREINSELNQEFLETNRKIKRQMMTNAQKLSNLLAKKLEDAEDSEIKFKPTDYASVVTAMDKAIKLVNEIPTEIINNRPISNSNIDEIDNMDELDAIEQRLLQEMNGETITDKVQ